MAMEILPQEAQHDIMRRYAEETLRDIAGLQFDVSRKEAIPLKGGGVRPTSGKVEMRQRKFKDMSPEEQLDVVLNNIDGFRAMRRAEASGKADEGVVPVNLTSQEAKDLLAILKEDAARSIVTDSVGQYGTHDARFGPADAEQNALQFLLDKSRGTDRRHGDLALIMQQGHIKDREGHNEIALDLANLRGQNADVNEYTGSGDSKHKSLSQKLDEGEEKYMQMAADMVNDYITENPESEVADRFLNRYLQKKGFQGSNIHLHNGEINF